MKRRDFSLLAGGAAVASTTLWSAAAHADAAKPEAGTDYLVVDPRAPVEAPAGKIEVVEFFWYSCPHCNAFEPMLEGWIKQLPKDVAFRRVPVAFRDDFVPQQRLFYALDAMGLVDKLHAKVFAAIHVEKQDLSKAPAILAWVGKQGVDVAKFTEQFNSFSVAAKASKGTQLQNSYKVEGVPALGVAGRFYVDGSLAKGMDKAIKVVEALAATVRSGK
ncbi:thiol:disulfide interchange protein DsbA/DsbL [Rhodoferax sp. GW822-FHT02A01]|uniref:thiol:disulfide interchange protein DsbA/DsbL n=1 Tax=Rhodoferax sp. GW822-FHT02A01 TaxID=3141537 RepID=UPI00315DE955